MITEHVNDFFKLNQIALVYWSEKLFHITASIVNIILFWYKEHGVLPWQPVSRATRPVAREMREY